LSAIIVAGDPAIRGLVSEVATRWGSTYLSLARLYSMWPRLSIFFRSTALTADQRKRRVAHRDWDQMRHLIAILTPVFEVTKECQRTSATLADIFSLVVALLNTLLLDTIVAPNFPEHPLAVGCDSIESFLQENPDDDVIELENRLYPSEAVYMETRDGYESLCEEAAVAVRIMRDEIDRLFFNPKENAKNWLKNPAVLSAVRLSPGGGRMLREVGDWVGMGDPTAEAGTAVLETAAKLQPTADAFGGCGSAGHLRSTAGISELRVTARSSLVLWQADVSPERERTLEPSRVDRAAREELSRFRRLSYSAMAGDALEFWRTHRAQFPALFVVAGSVFGAVGSSASCEREFYIAGRLVAGDRSSLSTGSVEMHSLVSSNADLLPFNTASVPSLSHAEAATFRDTMNGYVPSTDTKSTSATKAPPLRLPPRPTPPQPMGQINLPAAQTRATDAQAADDNYTDDRRADLVAAAPPSRRPPPHNLQRLTLVPTKFTLQTPRAPAHMASIARPQALPPRAPQMQKLLSRRLPGLQLRRHAHHPSTVPINVECATDAQAEEHNVTEITSTSACASNVLAAEAATTSPRAPGA